MDKQKMNFMIKCLSDEFYNNYPNPPYKEILTKRQRAYTCIMLQVKNYYICIPYRTKISHKYAYHFKNSKRSKSHLSGLDYTKIVIVKKASYIATSNVTIDKDEYNETVQNIARIRNEAERFVEDYVLHNKKIAILHPQEHSRRYGCSTLQYFHNELGF